MICRCSLFHADSGKVRRRSRSVISTFFPELSPQRAARRWMWVSTGEVGTPNALPSTTCAAFRRARGVACGGSSSVANCVFSDDILADAPAAKWLSALCQGDRPVPSSEKIPVEFLKALPKTDLHLHLDGSIRINTLIELASEYHVNLPSNTEAGRREPAFKNRLANLCGYLPGFPAPGPSDT